METVNIHEAKTNLSRLLQRVEAGEEILIARNGEPLARLSRFEQPKPPKRKPGLMKGRIRLPAEEEDAAMDAGAQA